MINGDIGDQIETGDRPLDGVAADLKGSAPAVWITFGATPPEHFTHGVHDVVAVRVLMPPPPEKSVLEPTPIRSGGNQEAANGGVPAHLRLCMSCGHVDWIS